MKKLVVLAIAVTAMACQQNKIGYVDSVKIMDDYQEKIDVEARFKTKADAMGRKRDSISQAFQMELQQFQSKAQSMLQQSAQEEYAQLQQRGQQIGQRLQQEEQQLQQNSQTQMDSLVKKVKKEIRAYGKANGYTYILGGGEGGSVIYGDDANDVTNEILKILNDKYEN
ncbi:MAG: OmpH family outer membrane protein [Muricauda sp.]|nr:OmpH family outer membrane protein [Allomuricauda sp.]MBO6532564.1 OmpH family outer membrane protein [Allomuricauda sp.]MBO6587999.1 OmpH family outer membrane protein [Allomuricauda sp.]MBO6617624.1 OmpH family outer membrane protein [Allomuricauda sp.]MBO6643365.1 OmpH family outer membrane protein [Allomuricauda sp.]MBO6745959.1 OmpH family outer membrane protein [Allomuricauda sp.]